MSSNCHQLSCDDSCLYLWSFLPYHRLIVFMSEIYQNFLVSEMLSNQLSCHGCMSVLVNFSFLSLSYCFINAPNVLSFSFGFESEPVSLTAVVMSLLATFFHGCNCLWIMTYQKCWQHFHMRYILFLVLSQLSIVVNADDWYLCRMNSNLRCGQSFHYLSFLNADVLFSLP